MIVITRELDYEPVLTVCDELYSGERSLFFDIETTGLRKETSQLYLIGCAWMEQGRWLIRQWLTQCAADEYEVLEEFLAFAAGFTTLVHFNGDRFDIPYLNYKCDYYMTGRDLSGLLSFDIYARSRIARNLLGGGSMSQKAVEEFLGICRDDQMNGGLLIPVYFDYEKTGDEDKKDLLLLHNYDDLQGMLKILPVLTYAGVFQGDFSFESLQRSEDTAEITFCLKQAVPVPAGVSMHLARGDKLTLCSDPDGCDYGSSPLVRICVREDRLILSFRLLHEAGCLPLTPVCDYYYLPDEDIVIHKELAQFLDRSRKTRATSKNCFAKKQGDFFFQPLPEWLAKFCLKDSKKPLYSCWEDLEEALEKDPEQTARMLKSAALSLLDVTAAS